jgi:hypothetical protein
MPCLTYTEYLDIADMAVVIDVGTLFDVLFLDAERWWGHTRDHI